MLSTDLILFGWEISPQHLPANRLEIPSKPLLKPSDALIAQRARRIKLTSAGVVRSLRRKPPTYSRGIPGPCQALVALSRLSIPANSFFFFENTLPTRLVHRLRIDHFFFSLGHATVSRTSFQHTLFRPWSRKPPVRCKPHGVVHPSTELRPNSTFTQG